MSTGLWVLVGLAAVAAVAMLAVAIGMAVRLVRARSRLRRAGLPVRRGWVVWAALAYLVLPTDLLPDPCYLDDIGVLVLALRSLATTPGADLVVRRRFGRRAGGQPEGNAGFDNSTSKVRT